MRGSRGAATERLFVAVRLTEQARSRIVAGMPELPGRLVPPQNWHFTLRFLGDTDATTRDGTIVELRSAPLGRRFTIRFAGLGAFSRPKRARIIWLGVGEGAARLLSLAEAVESASRRAGFPPETRGFKPHLTLSRIEPPCAVADILGERVALNVEMPVTEVALIQSLLGAGPARYEVVERFPLQT